MTDAPLNDVTTDVASDAATDVAQDAAPDATADAQADVTADATTDAATDGGLTDGSSADAVAVAPALQASGGVHRTAALPVTTLGTAIFMRLRTSTNAPPTTAVTVSVTGPMAGSALGWNGGNPLSITYPMGANFFGAYPAVVPVGGNYTLSAMVDGATVTSNFNVDLTSTPALEPTASITLSNVSATQVDGTWQAVTGAASYRFAVRDTSTTPPTVIRSVRVTTTTTSLTGLTLDRTRTTYDAEVLAYPVDLSPADVATAPAPFNVSFRRVAVTFP